MLKKAFAIMAIGASCVTGVQAAALADISGSVFIDKGSGFVPALSGMAVSAGDRVRVASGSASIDYGPGCKISLAGGEIVTVVSGSPCPPPLAGNGASGPVPAHDPHDGVFGSGIAPDALIAGGLISGGAAAAAIVLLNKNPRPASP